MYINSGYLNNSRLPFKDKSKPLIVGSCGTYRLQTVKKMPTWRPRGRLDYQLLYVVSGKAHFYFGDEEQTVTAGHMVLFQPRQEQHYEYFGTDKPEVYWVHFTGSNVKNILRKYEIPLDKAVFYSGVSATYAYLFKEMINELQTCHTGFEELLASRVAGISGPSAALRTKGDLLRRGEHLYEVAGLPEISETPASGLIWEELLFFTPDASETDRQKGSFPEILLIRRLDLGG